MPHRSFHGLVRAVFGIILSLVCLAGQGFPAPSSTALRLNVASEPPTLDWNLATDNVSYKILNNLMEGLTQYNERLEPIPALAESWEVSPDGLTYTFHLRRDVLWSDGVPLTVQHFIDSWVRLLKPATGAEYAYFLYDIVGAEDYNAGKSKDSAVLGIRAPDPFTLEVKLKHPAVYFPAVVTFMVTFPIRLELIKKYGDAWTEARNSVTLGPYTVSTWRHEYKIVLTSNPRFYGSPKPTVATLTIYMINEKTTALSLYETQSLDIVELPPLAIPSFRNHPEAVKQTELRGFYFGFNIAKKPFDQLRVRQAFSLAIDRTEFPRILHGEQVPTTSWIPPGMFGYNPMIGLAYDPPRAQRLLAAAGYPGGAGFPRIMAAFNTDTTNRLVAENLQAQWKRNLGVEIVLDHQEWKMYLKNLQQDAPALFRMGWGADYPDPDNFMNLFLGRSGNNFTHWASAPYDALVGKAATEPVPEKRKALYDQAQRLLCEEDAVIMPLFAVSNMFLVKPHVKNLDINPLGFVYFKKVRLVP